MGAGGGFSTDASGLETAADCYPEPIQFINAIQPYGYLIVLDLETLMIRQLSANLLDTVGKSLEQLIHQPVSELFGAASQAELVAALSRFPLTASPSPISLELQAADGSPLPVYGYLHAADAGHLVLELEPVKTSTMTDAMTLYRLVQCAIARLRAAQNLDELYQLAAQEIRALTGCDRVKIYRFDHDWSGIVVGEAKADDWLSSYKGMRFPAIDIPPMARRIFSLLSLRAIVDVDQVAVPLVPAELPKSHSERLDLSQSRLRAVSDCHLQYLRNMGVASSFTLGLVKEGQLWGLIACHHRTPQQIPHDVQAACDLLGQIIGLELSVKAEAADEAHQQQVKTLRSQLISTVSQTDLLLDSLKQHQAQLLQLMNAQGAYLQINGKPHHFGITPPTATVQRLLKWIHPHLEDGVFYTHHLTSLRPDLDSKRTLMSGVFVIALSQFRPDFLVWFRPEMATQVHWGGDPTRDLIEADNGYTLHPNFSFQLWKESVKGQSAPWQADEIEAAIALKSTILHQQLKHSQAETEVLIKEVHHRVKNNLQVVDSLLRQQARRAKDPQTSEALNDCHNRVLSMALVHEHLYESNDLSQISVSSYIRRLVGNLKDSYGFGDGSKPNSQHVNLDLDNSFLKINSAVPCGLIISELVSNAMKYAFPAHWNVPVSEISIKFCCDEDKGGQYQLTISDNGSGLPEGVNFETTRSLGLKLVRGLVHQLRGTIKIDREGGTTYTIQFVDDM